MSVIELKAYEVLKRYFQKEEDAAIIIEYFNKTPQDKIEQKKDVFLTKDDKIELIKEIKETRIEIKETKAEVIKWMIILLLPLYLSILGLTLLYCLENNMSLRIS